MKGKKNKNIEEYPLYDLHYIEDPDESLKCDRCGTSYEEGMDFYSTPHNVLCDTCVGEIQAEEQES